MHELTGEQQAIVEKARSIAVEGVAPHASTIDAESRFPEDSIDALRREGYLGLTVSSEFGGMGQGLRTMVAVLEEIAKECASTALCYLVHLAGAAAYAAAEPPREDLLRATAKGEHFSSLALGEFGSRSHFWAPVSQAERRDGKIVINASKSFVTSAGHADGFAVITRACESQSPTDTTIYYVSARTPGLRISGTWDALGMRGNASAPIILEDVALLPSDALSQPNEGMDMLLNTLLPIINLGVASICIGIAEAATEITKQHILTSKLQHMSMTLADLPNERARLARMRLETDKARAHLEAVLDSVERSAPDAPLMVLESKASAADMVLLVTDIAMKAAGGTAFNRHLGLERRFRDARAADFIGVTSDLLLEFIGRSLFGMPVP
jgi:alkylation response protein AidB-like acyl-CoA dehydrogenase